MTSQYEGVARAWFAYEHLHVNGITAKLFDRMIPSLPNIHHASVLLDKMTKSGFMHRVKRRGFPHGVIFILTEKGVETGQAVYRDTTISKYPIDLDDLYLLEYSDGTLNDYKTELLETVVDKLERDI